MHDEVVIKLSHTKIMLIALGSLGFVILGLWLFIAGADSSTTTIISNTGILFIISLASILFFSLSLVYSVRKLFDKKPGLIINNDGIYDNASSITAGQIQWSDIQDITISSIKSQNFLTVMVKEPEKYLNSGDKLKDLAVKANMRVYGSPIHISANALKISFAELEKTLDVYMEKYHKPVYSNLPG